MEQNWIVALCSSPSECVILDFVLRFRPGTTGYDLFLVERIPVSE